MNRIPCQHVGGRKPTKHHRNRKSCHHSFRVYPGSKTSHDAKITNIQQIISSLAARVTTLETVVPARGSWNLLGHSDGSTATGSLGSRGQGHLMITETQGVDLTLFKPRERTCAKCRPATVFVRTIPRWSFHVTNGIWEKSNIPAYKKLVRVHCKTGGQSARLVFDTRVECQDFVAHDEDEAPSSKLIVLSKRQNQNHSRPVQVPPKTWTSESD